MNQKLLKGMKWLNKFENGGQVENTLRKVMSSLTSLIKRSQKNDPEAKKQIQAILDDPNAQQMLAMIEQQSPELIEALHAEVQDVQMAQTGGAVEYLDSLKCGGRVKKAKKKEEGGEMTKNRIKTNRLAKGAKAPCPCSLKRIGGTIIEVDCEGVPVHKDGEKIYRKATPYESIQASPSIYATKEENGYTLPASYLAYASPDMWKWDVISPTNIKFPILKELIGYIPKTDAPIGRLIRTFNIESIPNDTSYITHSKKPFRSIMYKNITKGQNGYDDFEQLFKQTLNN